MALPFHHVPCRDQPQVIWLRDKCLYPRNHPGIPKLASNKWVAFCRKEMKFILKVGEGLNVETNLVQVFNSSGNQRMRSTNPSPGTPRWCRRGEECNTWLLIVLPHAAGSRAQQSPGPGGQGWDLFVLLELSLGREQEGEKEKTYRKETRRWQEGERENRNIH